MTTQPKKPAAKTAVKKTADTFEKTVRKIAAKKKPTPKDVIRKRTGKPSIYTEEIAREIVERLTSGERITSIVNDPRMPGFGTICDWEENTIEVNGVHTFQYPWFAAAVARARIRNAEIQLIQAGDIVDAAGVVLRHPKTGRIMKDDSGREIRILTHEAIAQARSQANYRQWMAERIHHRYKPKQTIEQTGANGGPIQTANANANFDHSSLVDAFKEVIKKGI